MTFVSTSDAGFDVFEEWWNKSGTVPFYLIIIILPLLNFKSPSFFAKFNILGKQKHLWIIHWLKKWMYKSRLKILGAILR